jgi:hypothetical protein
MQRSSEVAAYLWLIITNPPPPVVSVLVLSLYVVEMPPTCRKERRSLLPTTFAYKTYFMLQVHLCCLSVATTVGMAVGPCIFVVFSNTSAPVNELSRL